MALSVLSIGCDNAGDAPDSVDITDWNAPAPGLPIDAGSNRTQLGYRYLSARDPFRCRYRYAMAAPAGCDGLYAAPGPYVAGVTTVQYQGQTIEGGTPVVRVPSLAGARRSTICVIGCPRKLHRIFLIRHVQSSRWMPTVICPLLTAHFCRSVQSRCCWLSDAVDTSRVIW